MLRSTLQLGATAQFAGPAYKYECGLRPAHPTVDLLFLQGGLNPHVAFIHM